MAFIRIPIHITKKVLFKEGVDPLAKLMKTLDMELGHSFLVSITLTIRFIVRTVTVENSPGGAFSVLSLKIAVVIFEIELNEADNVTDFVRERLMLFAGPVNEESDVLFRFSREATVFREIVGVELTVDDFDLSTVFLILIVFDSDASSSIKDHPETAVFVVGRDGC